MLEKSSKMCVRQAMMDLVGEVPAHGEQERFLVKVAASCNLSYRTARSLWNGEIGDGHKASIAVRERLAIKQARLEAANLANRFEQIAGVLNVKDEDFYGPDVAALVRVARILRGADRTGDR